MASIGGGLTTCRSANVTFPKRLRGSRSANGTRTVPGTVKKHVPLAITPGSMTTWWYAPAGATSTIGPSNRVVVTWAGSGPW